MPRNQQKRQEIEAAAKTYASREALIAPMDWDELLTHRDRFMRKYDFGEQHLDFVTVLLSNAVWKPVLSKIPYHKRVLLMPQCLKNSQKCQAEIDEFGLLCLECGGCAIGPLQQYAERLGYSVVVAEGTTIVTQMIESGAVEAVVGVSCLSVLERAFPSMANHAVPGVAVPLLKDGCVDTEIDSEWLRETLADYSPDEEYNRLDLDEIMAEVREWFNADALEALMNCENTLTEQQALQWVCNGGKRWRPMLTAAAYRALTGASQTPEGVRKAAIAVECFHKASLVHDDLADEQDERYGKPALHQVIGSHVALNVGDLLIGEGYRLLSECGYDPKIITKMMQVAAMGHRNLTLGQGGELSAEAAQAELSIAKIIELFRLKTSPAFAVALGLGAVCADADDQIHKALNRYSDALGIAYQIQDDIEDTEEDPKANGWSPSIVSIYLQQGLEMAEAKERAQGQLQDYRKQAIAAVRDIHNSELKTLLHRLCNKILPHD